eukprot:scaffold441_cov225-Chaetoceros_neogracile.AAC.2
MTGKFQEATNLKEKGNDTYKLSRFADAKKIYTTGIGIIGNKSSVPPVPVAGNGGGVARSSEKRPHDENNQMLKLCAVLYSNRGNCCFELSDYSGAAQDSRVALDLIHTMDGGDAEEVRSSSSSSKNKPLQDKNQWRLARSLYYGKETKELKKLIADINDGYKKHLGDGDGDHVDGSLELQKKLSGILKSVEFFETRRNIESSSVPSFSPQLVRPSLSDPICEYYHFGHDNAESALDDVVLEQVVAHGQSEINVLYGGVGDGRNVFATILDIHHQKMKSNILRKSKSKGKGKSQGKGSNKKKSRGKVNDNSNAKNKDFKIHITMNDINAQVLVKDILVLILSHRIATLVPNLKDLQALCDNNEAFLLTCVIYYATLAYAMPSAIYDKLQSLMKEIFLDSTCKSFCEKYPWLYIDEHHWPAFQKIASFWADTAKYDPPLSSTKGILNHLTPRDPFSDTTVDLSKIEAMGLPPSQMEQIRQMHATRNMRDKMAKDDMDNLLESYRDMSTWPDSFKEAARENCREGASDEELIEFGIDTVKHQFEIEGGHENKDNPSKSKTAMVLDKKFLFAIHTLLPPQQFANLPALKRDATLARDIYEEDDPEVKGRTSSSSLTKVLQKYREHIHSQWKVNPVQSDPDYRAYTRGVDERDDAFIIEEFCGMFFHPGIQKKLFVGNDNWTGVFHYWTFFQIVAIFYVNTGKAISNLVADGNLTMEVSYGSVLDLGKYIHTNASKRLNAGLPSSFSRMMLSNVPDYVGLLSTFTQLSPLLAKDSAVMPSTLRSNVLLNTGIFNSYDEYVSGTLAMTAEQSARLLRLRILEEKPDVWNHWNRWGVDERPAQKNPIAFVEFKTWLHRLYMMCVLPPPRDITSSVAERRPNTVGLFLHTCKYCIDLGYPVHWITTILDQLLSSSSSNPLTTKALIANQSPSTAMVSEKPKRYNLSAFRLELENQLSLFMQNGLLPDTILSMTNVPVASEKMYHLKIKEMEYLVRTGMKVQNLFNIGFLLQKETDDGYKKKEENPFLAMMIDAPTSQHGSKSLRYDLLRQGNRVGHLFSCAGYNAVTNVISFCMCEAIFEEYRDYFLSIVRTDGWHCVNHPAIRLGEASIIA